MRPSFKSEAIRLVLILSVARLCAGFGPQQPKSSPSPIMHNQKNMRWRWRHALSCPSSGGSSVSLGMSYLDSLNPQQPPEEPGKRKEGRGAGGNKFKPRSGGVPSGRGPLASYLDVMTGAAPADAQEEPNDELPEEEEGSSSAAAGGGAPRPASWSSAYLTDLRTGTSGGQDDRRTDVRNLLTQRAIQSFMHLLEQCRDPHSAKWIQEDFLQTGNLLDYHGTGAAFIENFGGTWDGALLDMLGRPKERMIISAKRRGRGHGGWSKNNPYLEERWMEMPIDIYPLSLCERILSVREQIAAEWVKDLDVLITANDLILDSYFSKVRARREQAGEQSQAWDDVAFDRTAANLLNDESRFAVVASSPFRRANFDLLYTLCTQAAIHRIIREHIDAGQDKDSYVSFAFLKDFYTDRAVDFFDGNLAYGRADDFIDELLQTNPSILSSNDGRTTGLVDPLGTAETIIRMRTRVATEWKGLMERVPDDHIRIQQAKLSKQMQSLGDSSGVAGDESAFQ